ncbi:DUF6308 family protein [Aestuariimicrobium soli]|uniref:DUF6308 family protein n=1 Tax=Aestuariimicrobium soli TaxID=2035834 RepID=UPI003EBEC5CD
MDPSRHFAFATYDVEPLPREGGGLRPEDVLAANLLSLRLGWQEVIPLFAAGDGPAQRLRACLDEAVVAMRAAPNFEAHPDEASLADTYRALAAANEATRDVAGWTPVTVSKVLHRFAPHAVPIVDSRVLAFHDVSRGEGAKLRERMWRDVRANLDWLAPLAAANTTPDGRPLTVLRATDIIIWTPPPQESATK